MVDRTASVYRSTEVDVCRKSSGHRLPDPLSEISSLSTDYHQAVRSPEVMVEFVRAGSQPPRGGAVANSSDRGLIKDDACRMSTVRRSTGRGLISSATVAGGSVLPPVDSWSVDRGAIR